MGTCNADVNMQRNDRGVGLGMCGGNMVKATTPSHVWGSGFATNPSSGFPSQCSQGWHTSSKRRTIDDDHAGHVSADHELDERALVSHMEREGSDAIARRRGVGNTIPRSSPPARTRGSSRRCALGWARLAICLPANCFDTAQWLRLAVQEARRDCSDSVDDEMEPGCLGCMPGASAARRHLGFHW